MSSMEQQMIEAQREQLERIKTLLDRASRRLIVMKGRIARQGEALQNARLTLERMEDEDSALAASIETMKSVMKSEREAMKNLKSLVKTDREVTLGTHVEGLMAFDGDRPEHL